MRVLIWDEILTVMYKTVFKSNCKIKSLKAFLILCITIDNRFLGRIGNFVVTLYIAGIACFVQ